MLRKAMTTSKNAAAAARRIAILYPGDRDARRDATADNNRFAALFQALTERGARPEPAVYHDDFCDEVRQQLLSSPQVDAVLVWVNPIHSEEGRDRTRLDAMLREVAAAGVFVSAHPDIIQQMGTKEVLYATRQLGWGCDDTQRYNNLQEMQEVLPGLLLRDEARVLKQYRGHSGIGIWKIALADRDAAGTELPTEKTLVRARQAQRGSVEEEIALGEVYRRCEPYFANGGKVIDQVYQARLDEGMLRCYLVHDQVAGFGHQAINALYPAPVGQPATEAPQPGPRLYYPPDMPEAQVLKRKMEEEFLPAMQKLLALEDSARLPVLWDADFLLGPKTSDGEDTYVLCEINVSSVAPFPDSAIPLIAEAVLMKTDAGG